MRERLFRRRPPAPRDDDQLPDRELERRLRMNPGEHEPPEPWRVELDDDDAWDRPSDMDLRAPLDARADGTRWDRPEEEFAPPLDRSQPHWSFAADVEGRESTAAAEDDAEDPTADDEGDVRWAFREPARTSRRAELPWRWDDPRPLVTAGGRPSTESAPRDPAQPGLFDPYDGFVLAGAATRRPAAGSVFGNQFVPGVPPGPARATATGPPPSLPPRATRRRATPARDESRESSPFDRERPDPVAWPPIPSDVLPPVPQIVSATERLAMPEADGRRFGWPPPQPRVSAVPISPQPSTVARRAADAAAGVRQQRLWPAESAAEDTPPASAQRAVVARLAAEAEPPAEEVEDVYAPVAEDAAASSAAAPATISGPMLVGVVATVVAVALAILLVAQLVAPGAR